jgi:hypothetical protein
VVAITGTRLADGVVAQPASATVTKQTTSRTPLKTNARLVWLASHQASDPRCCKRTEGRLSATDRGTIAIWMICADTATIKPSWRSPT